MAAQREWFEKDYYKVLGVPDTADAKAITRAYRKLARQLHPDANPGDPRAEERFKEVSAAYDVLGDVDKRKEYDEVRKLGPMAGAFGGGGGPGGFSFRYENPDIGDIGDLLGGLFGRFRRPGGGRAGPGPSTSGPRRGQDLEAELHLSFEDAVRGVTTSVNLTSEAVCDVCHGSGAAPGSTPVTCPDCGGRGALDEDQGLFSFSRPCPTCAGRGALVEEPCPNCRGAGIVQRPREVRVRIPAGVDEGSRIRVKGRGTPGRNGGPPGDLYVVTRVEPHPLFGRKGSNLTITVPVTFPEAALGADISVPTLEGDPVTIRIAEGTKSGRTFRVKGRGIPKRGGGAGDLLVTVEVVVPQRLSPEERKAIEDLAAASAESPRTHLGV